MKWTTPEQFVWLRDGIPQFHKARRDKGKLATWFADTTSSFLDTFALPVDERVKAPKVSPFIPPIQAAANPTTENQEVVLSSLEVQVPENPFCEFRPPPKALTEARSSHASSSIHPPFLYTRLCPLWRAVRHMEALHLCRQSYSRGLQTPFPWQAQPEPAFRHVPTVRTQGEDHRGHGGGAQCHPGVHRSPFPRGHQAPSASVGIEEDRRSPVRR